MIRTLVTVPYEIARLPLVIVDNTLADRLPETSGPRVLLDRAIGSADRLAGNLLGNDDIGARGAERLERTDKLLSAARLEREAEARREEAQEKADAGRQEAAEKREAAQDHAASGLDEAETVAARTKQAADEKANRTAAAKKAAADKRAADRLATVDKQKQRIDSAADANKRAAQRKAKAQLDDAREAEKSAAESRADAEDLEELAEAKKQERRENHPTE